MSIHEDKHFDTSVLASMVRGLAADCMRGINHHDGSAKARAKVADAIEVRLEKVSPVDPIFRHLGVNGWGGCWEWSQGLGSRLGLEKVWGTLTVEGQGLGWMMLGVESGAGVKVGVEKVSDGSDLPTVEGQRLRWMQGVGSRSGWKGYGDLYS